MEIKFYRFFDLHSKDQVSIHQLCNGFTFLTRTSKKYYNAHQQAGSSHSGFFVKNFTLIIFMLDVLKLFNINLIV